MTCHCGKTALFSVGKRGFCKDHKAEARELAAGNRKQSFSTGESFCGSKNGIVIGKTAQ